MFGLSYKEPLRVTMFYCSRVLVAANGYGLKLLKYPDEHQLKPLKDYNSRVVLIPQKLPVWSTVTTTKHYPTIEKH